MSLALSHKLLNLFNGKPLLKQNIVLWYSCLKAPMLALISPRVVEFTEERTNILIPLKFISGNAWGSMFFGAIASGCDVTGGFPSFEVSREKNVGILYKDMQMQFKRRVDGDLNLICEDNRRIQEGVREAARTGKRVNIDITVKSYVMNPRGAKASSNDGESQQSDAEVKPCIYFTGTLSAKSLSLASNLKY